MLPPWCSLEALEGMWQEGTGRKSSLGFTAHIPAAQVGQLSRDQGQAGSGDSWDTQT